MKKLKPRIYIDTSVVSYHTARLHSDPLIRSRQLATRRWWEDFRTKADFHVSTYVLDEILAGDHKAAWERACLVESLPVLVADERSDLLGYHLLHDLGLPYRSMMDAFHLASAAINGLNYIVSWNFKHMANSKVSEAYEVACGKAGLLSPRIFTPETASKGGLG